mmetsp:Transcript_43509/g.130509  ORF Transcript_43509/g.130509 Transcript_43509/m.130509 type:complete len:216 (+) Transcript_43509:315-962(+)
MNHSCRRHRSSSSKAISQTTAPSGSGRQSLSPHSRRRPSRSSATTWCWTRTHARCRRCLANLPQSLRQSRCLRRRCQRSPQQGWQRRQARRLASRRTLDRTQLTGPDPPHRIQVSRQHPTQLTESRAAHRIQTSPQDPTQLTHRRSKRRSPNQAMVPLVAWGPCQAEGASAATKAPAPATARAEVKALAAAKAPAAIKARKAKLMTRPGMLPPGG